MCPTPEDLPRVSRTAGWMEVLFVGVQAAAQRAPPPGLARRHQHRRCRRRTRRRWRSWRRWALTARARRPRCSSAAATCRTRSRCCSDPGVRGGVSGSRTGHALWCWPGTRAGETGLGCRCTWPLRSNWTRLQVAAASCRPRRQPAGRARASALVMAFQRGLGDQGPCMQSRRSPQKCSSGAALHDALAPLK